MSSGRGSSPPPTFPSPLYVILHCCRYLIRTDLIAVLRDGQLAMSLWRHTFKLRYQIKTSVSPVEPLNK